LESVTAVRRALGALAFLLGLALLVSGGIGFFIAGDIGFEGEALRFAGLVAVGGVALVVIGRILRGADRGLEYLATEGLGGHATIGSVTPTGRRRGSGTVFELDLVVDVAGRPPYPIKKQAVVPADLAASLQPGLDVPVMVDPAHPERVGIDLVELRQQLSGGSASADQQVQRQPPA
jgi:hypothetical protein